MLAGVRIIEIEALGPAPFAAMLLADLGADIITIHRKLAAETPGKGAENLLDRGKRSIALDLKDPEDTQILKRLLKTADGLIEGFRPGVMERLGLGPKDCHQIRPQLIYGRMTGWGQTGPKAAQAGHDLNYIGLSGALWYASAPDDIPIAPATLVGDIGGGAMYLTVGMLAGLLKARATGAGCVVDAAIVDGSAHMMNLLMSLRSSGGFQTMRGQSLLDGPHWSRVYRCGDGGYFTVQALEPKFYAQFLDLMGLAGDVDFTDQFDQTRWPVLTRRLAQIFVERPRAHWSAIFANSDACAGPVLNPEEAMAETHMQARGVWSAPEGRLQAAAAPRFDGANPSIPAPIPRRDQDRCCILDELEQLERAAP